METKMKTTKLSERQRWALLNALSLAAAEYEDCRTRSSTLKAQFEAQASECRVLHSVLESAPSIVLTDVESDLHPLWWE